MFITSAKPRKVIKFSIGEKVAVNTKRLTNASLNLYTKTKQAGMIYIHCPCNVKSGMVLEIVSSFNGGYILRGTNNFMTVVHPNDLLKIPEQKNG